jgi:erythronate-4-phosphate dehydrogenase
MHVPLEKGSKYPTLHLADQKFFNKAKQGCFFINAARGPVMDSDDFLKARAGKIIGRSVIDCWEKEPALRLDVMQAADIATPHIAGYSLEGRAMGTVHVYRELCKFLGLEPKLTLAALLPPPPVPAIRFDAAGLPDEAALAEIISRVYDIAADDYELRSFSSAHDKTRGENFEKMRKNYHMRREFRFTRVILQNGSASLVESLRQLEFQVVTG